MGVITGIYAQCALKWDKTMLRLDNFYIFWKFVNNTTGGTSTHHEKFCPTLGNGKIGFFGPPIPRLT